MVLPSFASIYLALQLIACSPMCRVVFYAFTVLFTFHTNNKLSNGAHKSIKHFDDFEQFFPVDRGIHSNNNAGKAIDCFHVVFVVTHIISTNGCIVAPTTRLILSSPDGDIIPLSSNVFY